MTKFFSFFITVGLIFISCDEKKSNSNNEEVLNAFSKIDAKSQNLFTQEDRKYNYKNSVAVNIDKKSSLKKNVSYNGYGSNSVKQSDNSKKKKSSSPKNKKKTNYSYKSKTPQTFSTYSTN